MSRAATDWAWSVNVKPATLKLILLSMADRADETHCCYPSIQRIVKDTSLNEKTVQNGINRLIKTGLVSDTGGRKGPTKRVRVLRLTLTQKLPQKRNDTENGNITENGVLNDPENGVQNQSLEPVIEPLNTLVSTDVETGAKKTNRKPDYIRQIWNQYPEHRRGGTDQQLWKKWKSLRLTESDADAVLSYLARANQVWSANPRFVPGLTKFIDEQRWKGPLPEHDAPMGSAPIDWDDTSWADGFNPYTEAY